VQEDEIVKSLNDEKVGGKSGVLGSGLWMVAASLLLLLALVAACGTAASTARPEAEPTAASEATAVPMQEPTEAPADADVAAAITPSVAVADQAIVDGTVTVVQVVSTGPGWLVIHAQQDGNPGPVLGYSPVAEGENSDVTVMIDLGQATETLYAMLHTDAGVVGSYEFPGADVPVLVDGQMVSPAFVVTAALAATPTAEPATVEPTMAPAAEPTATAAAATEAPPEQGEAEVELEDFQFVPQVLTVKVGTRVKFSNKDGVVHTVTSDTGLFDSGPLQKGEEFFYTFSEAGEFPYYCAPHGGPGGVGMAGTIIVVP
jgi:plastocyanin